MAISGDTVRLTAIFKDFSDSLVDPELIMVKFYDAQKVQLGEPIFGEEIVKDAPGVYHYDYIVPDGHRKIYYEWLGMINDKPSVERDIMQITFV